MRPGEMKIIYALMSVPYKGLTFTELKRATRLSAPVLSEYLAKAVKTGLIFKNLETRRYVIPATYSKASPYLAEKDREMAAKIFNIPMQAVQLGSVEDLEIQGRAYHEFLSYHLNRLSAFILYVIEKADRSSLKSVKPQTRKKQDTFTQEMMRVMEKQMDEFHASLKEYLDHWVVPFIHYLALAYIRARVEHPHIGYDVVKEFREVSDKNKFWMSVLDEMQKSERKG